MAHGELAVPVGLQDHIRGSARAPIVLVEYGDYECPYCRTARPVVETVRARLGPGLAFVYRHFPLSRIHPHAQKAAEAAEAAGAQGRFWPMHDLLFAQQNGLDAETFLLLAATLGLDLERFTSALETGMHEPHVRADFAGGVRSGVNGTPTFFMNGLRYDGPRDVESMVDALEQVSEAIARVS